jgi:hypothetical protein
VEIEVEVDSESLALIDEILELLRQGAFELDAFGKLTPASRRYVGSLIFLAKNKSPSLREALESAHERLANKSAPT